MFKILFSLGLLLSFVSVAQTNRQLSNGQLAYYGQDFYSKKITKELLQKVLSECHTIVNNKHDQISENCSSNSYRHTSVGYDSARKILFGEIYVLKDRKGTFVEDVYCHKKFYFSSLNDVSNMHTKVNIEHTWPQSRFNRTYDKNTQKSDMHHLYLTDSMANNRRGNHEFGEAGNRHDELNVENCDDSQMTHINGDLKFTPPVGHRGNVARSLFYFATRYDLQIARNEEAILRQWHKAEPVDAEERATHEIVAKHQKVRNPFVDYPELVDTITDF